MPPLLPPCATKDDYHRLVDLPEPWLAAVSAIAGRHGLPAPRAENHRPAGFVVFVLGECVLKLTAPWWSKEVDAERIALSAAVGRLTVPVPGLVAEGAFEGWPYLLITRLSGETLGARIRTLTPVDRAALCRDVGEFLRALHHLPVEEFPGLAVHDAAFEDARRRAAPDAQRRWGLDADMVEDLERAIADAPPLISLPPVPIHADLHHMNMLVNDPAHPRLAGVIDFGDAAIGPAEFDLAVPALFLTRGDGEALDALFAGYGLDDARNDDAFRRRLLLWMFLHPFGNMTRFVKREDGSQRGSLEEMERELLPPTRATPSTR